MLNQQDNNTKIDGILRDKNNKVIKVSAYFSNLNLSSAYLKILIDSSVVSHEDRRSLRYPATIEGKTEIGKDIYVTDFFPTQSAGHFSKPEITELRGKIGTYIVGEGLDKKIPLGRKIDITLSIPFSAFNAPRTQIIGDLGSIKIKDYNRAFLKWNEDGYKYQIYNTFSSNKETSHEFVSQLIEITHKSRLTISYITKSERSFKENILDTIEKLDLVFPLLGFLGKRRLNWYEASCICIPASKDDRFISADAVNPYISTNLTAQEDLDWFDTPLTMAALQKGRFKNLLKNLRLHPRKDAIIQAIEYLLSSYEQGYFFNQLTAAYTAFETLVTELGELKGIDRNLSDEEYNRLTKDLKAIIKKHFPDQKESNIDTSKNKRNDIYNKLSELKRKAIKAKFIMLFDESESPLTRFMFRNSDWKGHMGQLIDRRNTLIHAGKITREHLLDLYRLQLLLQLWILKLLECPEEYINEHIANALKHNN